MRYTFIPVVFIVNSLFPVSLTTAEELTPEQLERWFNDELMTDEERALAVNEGALVFLEEPPEKAVHYIRNNLTIAKDSLETGWVNLVQCHENLDAVAATQIVYRYKRMRNLTVDSYSKITKAWVEDKSVQLEDIKQGATLCIGAEVGILYSNRDGISILKNGPFHRKFLDGYYPMRVGITIKYPAELLRYESITPEEQAGFNVVQSNNELTVDAWFEGELRTEVRFSRRHKN